MADLYKANPSQFGGFDSPFPGGSSSKGYYDRPLNIPFTIGRSILATIPEYQRNPLLLEKDLTMTLVREGRANLMRILLEQVERGQGFTVNDVRFRIPIEVVPHERIYLKTGQTVSTSTKGLSKIKIDSNQTKIATAFEEGNIKQVGDISRLEVNQYVVLMFSWTEPKRTSAVSGSSLVYYNPGAYTTAPVPEICKIVDIDYENSTITVLRHWAGDQRSSVTYSSTTVPNFTVVANGTSAVWGTSGVQVPQKFAFLIPMAKSVQEDELEGKVRNYSGTWTYGVMQRSSFGFGSQKLAEVISQNLGLPSRFAQSREMAIEMFYKTWEYTAIFGQASEYFDPESGYWQGTTDGLLAKIPKSHFIAIKGIDWSSAFTAGNFQNFGTFNVYLFNKFLEGKAYFGSPVKNIICGSDFYTAFQTMINFMTQNVPDIKSEWRVEGKTFRSTGGLTVNVMPSDALDLNGMRNIAIMYDPQYFKPVNLKNYPGADIIEVNHENPLKRSGYIHGMKGFIDLNPDAHWVFTVIDKKLADGTDNTTVYNSIDPLGTPLE